MSDFIDTLYAKVDSGVNDRKLIDFIFNTYDDMFTDDRFEEVDKHLGELDVDRLCIGSLLALLTASGWSPIGKLPSRPKFYQRAKARLVIIYNGSVEDLLKGLE